MDEGWCAFTLCLLSASFITPEKSFQYLSMGEMPRYGYDNIITQDDVEDMIEMRNQKISYTEIGAIYGISRGAVFKRIKLKKAKQ